MLFAPSSVHVPSARSPVRSVLVQVAILSTSVSFLPACLNPPEPLSLPTRSEQLCVLHVLHCTDLFLS